MIAGLFGVYGRDYVKLCRDWEKILEAAPLKNLLYHGRCHKEIWWDGEWFIRAYDYYGHKMEAMIRRAKIFIGITGLVHYGRNWKGRRAYVPKGA